MSLFDSMNIASTALSAQTTRINTIASNMANANTVASTAEDTYRARAPIFQAVLEGESDQLGVRVKSIEEVGREPRQEFEPQHPLADENGFIYTPDLDVTTEMANMMSASRSFQSA
ncbi:MAG: flagellar basal body rod protein FlgC, partial [Luminiphilus sp.]